MLYPLSYEGTRAEGGRNRGRELPTAVRVRGFVAEGTADRWDGRGLRRSCLVAPPGGQPLPSRA